MARNVKLQLANSEGIFEILIFEGLSHSVVVHPTVHGEPLLTAQAFYYLEQLESVAEIRFEQGDTILSAQQIELLVDNYLFEYSKINSNSKMCTKMMLGKYWATDVNDMYMQYDQRDTEALVLDALNDPSVISIKALDSNDNVDFSDWCLVKNYSDSIFHSYLEAMSSLIHKKIFAQVSPTDERDGYIGKLRLLKCNDGLVDYYQAQDIDNISIRGIKSSDKKFDIKSNNSNIGVKSINIRRINLTKKYSPLLLSYYFSGLRENNPLLAFVGFYNVLEYYFEEAPILLSKTARNEREQIKCVIELLASVDEIETFISSIDSAILALVKSNIKTSSSIEIQKYFPASKAENINELGRWLYEIRCAIVHSKKTRGGNVTAIFEPYSTEAASVSIALPIIKWLSILCIEKDQMLSGV